MFERRQPPAAPVYLRFEGRELVAQAGDSVAAALLGAGIVEFRSTPVSGAVRAPFCMIGQCFDCLVEIDGQPNRQACMIEVAQGMQVARQRGARRDPRGPGAHD